MASMLEYPGLTKRLAAKEDLLCETGDVSEASERKVCSLAEMFKEFHGGRKLHCCSRRTWQALNKRFPGHGGHGG